MLKDTDILQQPEQSLDDTITALDDAGNTNCSITDIENLVNSLLKSLPKLNRNAIRYEMSEMIVNVEKNPTTYDINEGLALAQGYRDRLSELVNAATAEYKVRKRCLEMLFDAVNLISKASSADKRKGEATMKYPTMVMQVEAAELFVKEIEMIHANIKATADSISRQASVIGMQIQLGERRQSNPGGTDVIPQSNAEEVTRKGSGKGSNKEVDWDNF
jgi:hypothetical protein